MAHCLNEQFTQYNNGTMHRKHETACIKTQSLMGCTHKSYVLYVRCATRWTNWWSGDFAYTQYTRSHPIKALPIKVSNVKSKKKIGKMDWTTEIAEWKAQNKKKQKTKTFTMMMIIVRRSKEKFPKQTCNAHKNARTCICRICVECGWTSLHITIQVDKAEIVD